MITPHEALELAIRIAAPLAPRRVALAEASGLTLAEDIRADRDFPPFDRSMMDGFAVRLADAGRTVAIIGEAQAGSVWQGKVAAGQCLEILTGAPCPCDAEAVVAKENVTRHDNSVTLPSEIKPGQNIAPQASDCPTGQCVLAAGATITGMAIGTLAAFGRMEVLAMPRPSLGIITTGSELVALGDALPPGHLHNSNGSMLAAMAGELGLARPPSWHVADSLKATIFALEEAAALDIVVLSGGVSVGTYDFVPAALARLGAEIVFHGVKQKPGKPLLFARRGWAGRGSQLIFGLPGNPLSCHFGFHRYVSAAVRKMSGQTAAAVHAGTLTGQFECKGGRFNYLPAIAEAANDSKDVWRIAILPGASSADIFQNCRANCYVELPPEARIYKEGDRVTFTWM